MVAAGHELRFRQLCQQQGKCSRFIIFDSFYIQLDIKKKENVVPNCF